MRTHQPHPQDEAIKMQLAQVISELKKPEEIFEFLGTFMTESEYSMFARRLEIIRRLEDNESYLTIQRAINVSSATVAAVSQLRDLEPVQNYMKKIQKRKRSGWFS